MKFELFVMKKIHVPQNIIVITLKILNSTIFYATLNELMMQENEMQHTKVRPQVRHHCK